MVTGLLEVRLQSSLSLALCVCLGRLQPIAPAPIQRVQGVLNQLQAISTERGVKMFNPHCQGLGRSVPLVLFLQTVLSNVPLVHTWEIYSAKTFFTCCRAGCGGHSLSPGLL